MQSPKAFHRVPHSSTFTPEAMADVMINPGRPGLSEATIRVMGEDLSRFPAKDVWLALEPPQSRGPTLERGAVEEADGAWRVKDIALLDRAGRGYLQTGGK